MGGNAHEVIEDDDKNLRENGDDEEHDKPGKAEVEREGREVVDMDLMKEGKLLANLTSTLPATVALMNTSTCQVTMMLMVKLTIWLTTLGEMALAEVVFCLSYITLISGQPGLPSRATRAVVLSAMALVKLRLGSGRSLAPHIKCPSKYFDVKLK